MKEEAAKGRASRLLNGFKNIVGVGWLLLIVGLLLEGIAIFARRWITFPIPLTVGIRVLLALPCLLVAVVGAVWFNCSLNLVKVHVLGGEHKLMTSGPFNYVRHPLYASLLMGLPPLLIIGYADLLFIIPWLLILFVSHYLVRLEERDLINTFGDDYRNYRKYVPALIPYKGAGGRRYRAQCEDVASVRSCME